MTPTRTFHLGEALLVAGGVAIGMFIGTHWKV